MKCDFLTQLTDTVHTFL